LDIRPQYRLYIDETGNSDTKSAADPNHRFLTLTGVIIHLDYVDKILHPQMEDLKRRYFKSHPDDPIILHRSDINNARGSFYALKNPSVREAFDTEVLRLIGEWNYKVISVIIDKKELLDRYSVWQYDPYHYSLKVILERYVYFLEQNHAIGDAMAESRGGKEDMRLKLSYERLYESGSEYISTLRFHQVLSSKQLKVKNKSSNVSGLQLADLLAHPSRLQMLRTYNLKDEDYSQKFAGRIVELLKSKYLSRGLKIEGYGMKKLP